MLLFGFFLGVFSLSIISAQVKCDENLVAAAVIYRHGDRSPEVSCPKDKYFDKSFWPMGFAQLTQNGIKRQYELGQWFRQRYSNFLNQVYSPDEIYVYSTNVDRTLMSASANLAGLYPPKHFQIWHDKISWQPIPVHSKDIDKDDILTDKRKCRKFSKTFNKLKRSRYINLEKQYFHLFNSIKEYTGWDKVSIDRVRILQKNFYAYQHYNSTFIPDWYKNLDINAVNYLTALTYEIPTSTPFLTRLRIGPFFSYLFQHFDHFVKPSAEQKAKFLMISAHDGSLTSILDAMGVFKMQPIQFADTILWELKNKNGTYYMNVLYKQEDKLEKLNIFQCDFNCDYNRFKENLFNVTVDIQQWKKECDNKNEY